MSQTETEGAFEDLIIKFEGMGYPIEIAEKLASEIMYGRGVGQENEYVVRPGRGYNTGGSVGGIGQFMPVMSAQMPQANVFNELGHPNALPSFVDAPTPEEEIESAIRSGTASDEEFFALAKAKQSKSPIARQFHMDRANRIKMGIV